MSLAAIDNTIDQALREVTQPVVVRGLIHLLLALYVVRLAPELPKSLTSVFDNQYLKLLVFAIVLWTAQFSPSTAIMIAFAFMVSVNIAMNKPIWEMLENETTEQEIPQDPAQATAVLAQAAASEGSMPAEQAQQALDVVTSSVQTQEGADAAARLAAQATAPVATPTADVSAQVKTVVDSMQPSSPPTASPVSEPVPEAPPAPVTNGGPAGPETAAVEAVKDLAKAAASPEAMPVPEVSDASKKAMDAVTTQKGAEAVVELAKGAMEPVATPQTVVEKEAVTALAAMPEVSEQKAKMEVATCFPQRQYDLSKLTGYEPMMYELNM